MNKILLLTLGFGPTYKKRYLKNLKEEKGYDLYDVLIITDDVEYWNDIKYKDNIFIEHIDDLRKDYPWSYEYEKLATEKRDDVKYAQEIHKNNLKFPSGIVRFFFNWDKINNYDGFIFINTDIIPIYNVEAREDLLFYFSEKKLLHPFDDKIFRPDDLDIDTPKNKMVLVPGGATFNNSYHSYLYDYAKKFNDKFKIKNEDIKNVFHVTDFNGVSFNFPDKSYHKKFFNLFNSIVKEYYENPNDYYYLGPHTIWQVNIEYMLSIIWNLTDSVMIPYGKYTGLGAGLIKVETFPEDRFWYAPFISNYNENMNQQDWIKANYNILKEFYENHGKSWPY